MKLIVVTALTALFASPALAGVAQVPEMDVGAGVAAIALLAGAAAIVREKFFRK